MFRRRTFFKRKSVSGKDWYENVGRMLHGRRFIGASYWGRGTQGEGRGSFGTLWPIWCSESSSSYETKWRVTSISPEKKILEGQYKEYQIILGLVLNGRDLTITLSAHRRGELLASLLSLVERRSLY